MNQEQIFQKVTEIIQERQGKDFVVQPTLGLKDDLGADSVDLMEFILTLEDEFAIEISDEDVDRFENVADIVAYLEKKLAKQEIEFDLNR